MHKKSSWLFVGKPRAADTHAWIQPCVRHGTRTHFLKGFISLQNHKTITMDLGFVQDLRGISELLDKNSEERESDASTALANPTPGSIGPSQVYKNVKVADAKRKGFYPAAMISLRAEGHLHYPFIPLHSALRVLVRLIVYLGQCVLTSPPVMPLIPNLRSNQRPQGDMGS